MDNDTVAVFGYLSLVAVGACFIFNSVWPIVLLSGSASLTVLGRLFGFW